jgi:hypothetical protein
MGGLAELSCDKLIQLAKSFGHAFIPNVLAIFATTDPSENVDESIPKRDA